MHDRELYKVLLGLQEPWFVSDVDLDAEQQMVTVLVQLPARSHLVCQHCGQPDCPVHDYQDRTWRHLDTCQFKTFIQAPLPRIKCPKCGVKTVSPPWASAHSRFTLLFERLAIDVLQQMSISATCKILRISWDEADRIIERAVKRGLERRKIDVRTGIGIDEKAFRGNRFLTIVHSLSTSEVLWVGKTRQAEALDEFFEGLGPEQCASIPCIATDMWKGYALALKKWIPDALDKIVLDRFHIERYLSNAVDEMRKMEHRLLSRSHDRRLQATKWDWLEPLDRLTPERRARFDELRRSDLTTAKAYAQRENFQHIWQMASTQQATEHFHQWYNWVMHSTIIPMKRVAKMLKRHLPQVLNYLRTRVSNSRAEGINNKIQSVKKKAYGFRNIDRMINMIYFHCSKLDLYPNPL